MTPLSNTEGNQLMTDVAALKTDMAELKRWRVDVEQHDRRQDDALYAVERKQDSLERRLDQWETDRKADQRKTEAWHKAILALAGCSAIDAVGWNLWNYVQPFLEPFMSRRFFWFSISMIGFLLLVYGLWILLNSSRKAQGQSHVKED